MSKCTTCDGTGTCEIDNDSPNRPIFDTCYSCKGTGNIEAIVFKYEPPLESILVPADLIRKIRDQFGDDKCWMDWNALFALLPEGYTPPTQDIPIQLENCKHYLACRDNGTEYIPPPRWVKGLPDKPGVWVLTTENNFRITATYRGGSLNIKDAPVYCSFGPIPREPECLIGLKEDLIKTVGG